MHALKDTFFGDSSDCFSTSQAFPVDVVWLVSAAKWSLIFLLFFVAVNVLFLFVEGGH